MQHRRPGLLVLLGLGLWAGCSASDKQTLTAPTAASPQLEQQAIANLFDLYRQALLQEDIDRLQALLAAETPSPSRAPCATRLHYARSDGAQCQRLGRFS